VFQHGFEHQQTVKPNRTKTRFLKRSLTFEGSQKGAKGSQKGAKGSQKGAKDQENHQVFFIKFFFFKIVKTVMAHL
jgi:hypothetical protein